MDCKYMIEINDKGLFQDLRTGLKYHEITKEMIEGCLLGGFPTSLSS